MEQEVEQVRRSLKAEIVPYGAYDAIPVKTFRIGTDPGQAADAARRVPAAPAR